MSERRNQHKMIVYRLIVISYTKDYDSQYRGRTPSALSAMKED